MQHKYHLTPTNEELLLLGRLLSPHGIRGLVMVESFTQEPGSLFSYPELLLGDERGGAVAPMASVSFQSARPHKHHYLCQLSISGVLLADRTQLEQLLVAGHKHLFLRRADLRHETKEDEYFHTDLLGLSARNDCGTALGKVLGVHNFGAGDLLEIGTSYNDSFYVPFRNEAVLEVSLEKGVVIARPFVVR